MTGQETDRGRWSRLRMAAQKGFSSTSSALGRALKHPSRAALVIFFLVIAVLWTHEWVHRKLEALDNVWLSSDRTGLIMIDTPQLYTRERLVNDRFREAAWLEQRLENTDDLLTQQRFGQADLFVTAIRDLKLHASKIEAASDDDSSSTAPLPATPSQDLQPSPQDEFDDVLRYREAIREFLMAMQLDDRHDIAGNTIYRLNFRAMILPEPGTRKLAAITVALRENPNDATAYFDLLYDWRDELQRQIVDLVDDKTNTLLRGSALITAEQRQLNKYIDEKLINHRIADFWGAIYWPIFQKSKEGFDAAVLQLLGIEQDGDRNDILAIYHDKCSRALQQSRSPEVFLHPGEIAAITGEATNGAGQNIPCLVFGLNESLLKMDAAYILDFLIEDAHVQSGQPGSCHGAEVIQHVLMNLNEDRCSDQARGLRARWQQMDERMRRQGVLARFIAEVLLKEKEAGTQIEGTKGQLMLRDFFSFDVEDCSEYCYPVVGFQSISSDSQCFDGEANSDRLKDQPTKVLADCLESALSRAGVATYAVTPDRAVQRLQLLEKEALFMDATYGGVSSFGGREVLETAALEREPVAFGIGDWGRTIDPAQSDTKFAWVILPRRRPLSGGRFEQAADHVNISAIVSAPSWWKSVRLTVTTCWMDSTDLVGEADPDKLCKDPGVDQHGDQNDGYKFEVALPGNASEIMTKLRFDVLTFPYLFGQRQYQNVLEVGRKGSLIILGGRLWRSPRVIMGNQIADRIEVLPDMDGIIAHFNCVQPYPGTPGLPDRDENSTRGSGADTAGSNQTEPPDSAQRASSDQDPDSGSNIPPVSPPAPRLGFAVVWTSEGRTSNLPVEFRPYSKRVGQQAEDPCWLHEDQDGRSVESSESPSPADQPSGQDAS